MTDHHLTHFAIKAQEDARRCYQIYVQHRIWMDNHPGDVGGLYDARVWQYRASIAAEHALKMLGIVTR